MKTFESLAKNQLAYTFQDSIFKYLLLICNIWKHPQNGYKGNHELKIKKNEMKSWCTMPLLSKEKKTHTHTHKKMISN